MSRIVVSRIVAAVDATPRSAPVLRWAAREADLTGSRVLALTATGGSERWGLQHEATPRRSLTGCLDTVLSREQAARTQRAVVRARPFDALVKASVEADLLVLGTRPQHLPWGAHELTARVLAQATCPVAVVPERPAPDTGRIVVGVDGSPASLAALRWAARRAVRAGAVLIAVTAWPRTEEDDAVGYEPDGEGVARHILDDTLDHAPGLQCVRVVAEGHPADVLLDMSPDVDLIVVGHDGAWAFGSHRLGSVSRRVAQRSHCPVVIAHETDEAGPA